MEICPEKELLSFGVTALLNEDIANSGKISKKFKKMLKAKSAISKNFKTFLVYNHQNYDDKEIIFAPLLNQSELSPFEASLHL